MVGDVSLDASGALARGDAVSACSVQVDASQVTTLPAGAPATTLTAQARLEVSGTR
jgi:ubiquinone biosynthesis protein UbiJ